MEPLAVVVVVVLVLLALFRQRRHLLRLLLEVLKRNVEGLHELVGVV